MPKTKKGWHTRKPEKRMNLPPETLVRDLIKGKCLRAIKARPEWIEKHLDRLSTDHELHRRLVDRLMTFEEDEMSLLYWMLEDKFTQEEFLHLVANCIDFQTRDNAPPPTHERIRWQ